MTPGGTVFAGRYRVLRRVGSGGSASVFHAEDERLGRAVAIKRLHGAETTEVTAARLRREARIMASLQHPNLVAVFDMLTEDDDLVLVMEYVGGGTLADVLDDAPLEPARVAELLHPVAEALAHIHAHGVVHRDVKPTNVLIGEDGAIKLGDLGLATAAEITRITPPGSITGTPAYMAPEQATAAPCTSAADVYALATIAFQALSGRLPRTGSTAVAVLRQAASQPPADLREHRERTPAAAAELLKRGMAADPAERPRSATAFIDELERAFEPPGRRRRPARLVALAALGLAVAAIAALALAGALRDGEAPRVGGPAATPTATAERTATATATAARRRAPSPVAAVRAFYSRAARGDFDGAWRLAGPGMRSALGGSEAGLRRNLGSLRRIEFRRAQVTSRSGDTATVAVETIATHTDRVDHCTGDLRTVRSGGRWVVEPAGLRCEGR